MAGTPKGDEFLGNFRFIVQVDGIQEQWFKEVEGLEVHVECVEYQEGGQNENTHKLPGQIRFSNVCLKRGFATSDTLYKWYQKWEKGPSERKNVQIMLCNNEGNPKFTWKLKEAYPCRWESHPFNSTDSAMSIECVEFAHHGFELSKG